MRMNRTLCGHNVDVRLDRIRSILIRMHVKQAAGRCMFASDNFDKDVTKLFGLKLAILSDLTDSDWFHLFSICIGHFT